MDAYSVGRGALRRSIRLCALSAGLAALVAAASPVRAQAEPEPEPEWTVLTVAQSGAWGLSTARSQGEAIARALGQCQSRASDHDDCGAELLAYKVGWSLAILCGEHRVLASGADLREALTVAYERIAVLRQSYPSGLATCRRLLTVDECGVVTVGEGPDTPLH